MHKVAFVGTDDSKAQTKDNDITIAKSGKQSVSANAGKVKMLATVDGEQLWCVVYDILYVPGLTLNLFSVKKIGE